MGSSAPKKSSSTIRYERYKSIVDCLVGCETFGLLDVQNSCSAETPRFVTRVVGELEKHGWIVRETEDSSTYRWNVGRGEFNPTRWLDEKMFGTQIKESPEQTRPRERLLEVGAENLSDAELLAILIRSGRPGESAVMGGEKLAKVFNQRLADLPSVGRAEVKAISPAIDKTAYCQIMAGIELGRRVAAVSATIAIHQIKSSADAMTYCRHRFARLAADARQEEFHVVTLNTKSHVIQAHQITVGTLDASLVHPREVFRPAIRDAAASVILVHNHPSGDPTPSREDFAVTDRLTSAGDLLGIQVLDHIVLGRDSAQSIRECER